MESARNRDFYYGALSAQEALDELHNMTGLDNATAFLHMPELQTAEKVAIEGELTSFTVAIEGASDFVTYAITWDGEELTLQKLK